MGDDSVPHEHCTLPIGVETNVNVVAKCVRTESLSLHDHFFKIVTTHYLSQGHCG